MRTRHPEYRNRASSRAGAVLLFVLAAALGLSAQHKVSWPSPPQAPPKVDPQQQAIVRTFLRAGRLGDLRWPNFSDYSGELQNFYSRRSYAPAWLRDGQPTPQALQMIAMLQQADTEGLDPEDYDASRWPERLAALPAQHSALDQLRFDVALTVCAMRYVSGVRVGRINPRYFKFALDVDPKDIDLPQFVQERLAGGENLKSEVARLEPSFGGYHELKRALVTYMQLAKQDHWERLPEPTGLGYPGPPYPGLARLTRLLRLVGDLPGDYSVVEAGSRLYDPDLLEGVRRFQQRHGLPVTGYLNEATVQELNVPLTYRVEQIRLALERYRWVRYDFPRPPIVVNIPGSSLNAFDANGKIALSMKVDVGEDFDSTRTPVMEENIEYVVFRPYWNVPMPIQRNEIVPILEQTPRYLSEFHFDVLTSDGKVLPHAGITSQILQGLRAGRLRLRQRPGPDNALGLIKFDFPNRYNVYLHDIPSREFYFSFPQRMVSHGCVHVEKPVELAAWVLRDQPEWTPQRVRQAMRYGRDNVQVKLSRPLPVLFVYTTVSARGGDVHFYRDIYGYDAELLGALAKGYPYPK